MDKDREQTGWENQRNTADRPGMKAAENFKPGFLKQYSKKKIHLMEPLSTHNQKGKEYGATENLQRQGKH